MMEYEIQAPGQITGALYGQTITVHWPFEHLVVDGRQLEQVFGWLDAHHNDKLAVVSGPFASLSGMADMWRAQEDRDRTPQAIIQAADRLTVDGWRRKKRQDLQAWRAELKAGGADEADLSPARGDWSPARGEWPDNMAPQSCFQAHMDYATGAPYREVYITLLPVRDASLWAAYLNWGDWNECPAPGIHVMLARHWAHVYGARIRSVTHDVVEYEIRRPVHSREQALELAELHYLYCNDIVDQNYGTLENLAASLIKARVWSFWWD